MHAPMLCQPWLHPRTAEGRRRVQQKSKPSVHRTIRVFFGTHGASIVILQSHESLIEEFDSGSERTLAACLIHASRARNHPSGWEYSGERVSNTWTTYPGVRDNPGKLGLIPDGILETPVFWIKATRSGRGSRPISLLAG